MIWFFKRHCIHNMNMCVCINIYIYLYCLPWILYVENTHVWLCFCVLYWNHQVLVPSSYSFACLIGLGGRDLVTQCTWCPPLWNSKFWIWIFWKPSKIQHPILHPSSTFECNKGGFNHALHGASFHAKRRISLAPGTLFSPKQSKWQQLGTEYIHLIDDLQKDLVSPYSTKQFHETRMTTQRNMLYRNGFGMSHVSWYIFLNNRRLGKKTLQAGCSFNPQNKTLKGSQFQGKFASTELSNWIVNANLRRLPRTVIRCSFWQNQHAYFLEAKHPDCPNCCVSIWLLLKSPIAHVLVIEQGKWPSFNFVQLLIIKHQPAHNRWLHSILLFPPCGKLSHSPPPEVPVPHMWQPLQWQAFHGALGKTKGFLWAI